MVVFAKEPGYALDSLCDLGYQVVGLDWLQDQRKLSRSEATGQLFFRAMQILVYYMDREKL